MIKRYKRPGLLAVSLCLLVLSTSPAGAQDAQSVKMGEAALRFAAGSIRHNTPQAGIVNRITGDNQTTGSRMILGWRESDILYLKLAHPQEAAIGDLYTIYKKVHKVFHPRTKEYMGYLTNMTAVVRVIDTDSSVTTVQMVRVYAPVSPGDPVMKFSSPSLEESSSTAGAPPGGEGLILDLQSDKNMSLVGQGNIVYIDQGRADGIQTGDRLDVFRIGGSLPRRKVGELKVLSCEERTATAVIARSMSRVFVGDRVRYKEHGALEELSSDDGARDMRADSPLASTGVPVVPKGHASVRVEPVPGGMRINLEDLVDQLEYESGEVKVKPAGLPVLERIADYLRTAAADKQIRIEGHADNMEIGPALKATFPSNWELSKARAAGIVRHLVENGGLDSAKLSSVGYGASRPSASNATEEGRKRNRRIEIVLYDADPLAVQEEATDTSMNPSAARPSPAVVLPAVPMVPLPGPHDQGVAPGTESDSTAEPGSDAAPVMPASPAQ